LKIPDSEALIVRHIGEPLLGGVNHYEHAIVKYRGKYYLVVRHCRPAYNAIGMPDWPWSCEDYWYAYEGPFKTLEEAESRARELGDL